MALTNTIKVVPTVPGAGRWTVTEAVFDSSYATGGEILTASDLGLTTVLFASATIKVAGTGSVTSVFYDVANGKLLAYAAAAQIANAVDLSAVTAQVVAYGS